MKLLVQPDDGLAPLLKTIDRARKSIDIMIFRFDRSDIEAALARAVARGVTVRALVAHLNKSGEDGLRALELRLLGAGVSVARTAGELVRYHGKLMIVDRRELHLFGFNFTSLDMERSRSFGIVTHSRGPVQEALRLFEADRKRVAYKPRSRALVVSPAGARQQLAAFLRRARHEILIYDPSVSDPAMIRILEERARAGVTVRVIGRLARRNSKIESRKLSRLRLHTRTIVRDGRYGFVGSQSLRAAELDTRREIGIIFGDRKAVARIAQIFEADWQLDADGALKERKEERPPVEKVAKKVAKVVIKELPPVAPALKEAIKELGMPPAKVEISQGEVEASVKNAVKTVVKEIVKDAVEDAAGPDGSR